MKTMNRTTLFVLLALALATAGWSGTKTTGLTSISTTWVDDLTVEFTLYNNSDYSNPATYNGGDYLLLVDSLQLTNGALSTAHVGLSVWTDGIQRFDWSWKVGGKTEVQVQSNQKYYAPPSLGPEEAITFILTFDNASYIPINWDFEAHVLAVKPQSNKNDKYQEFETAFGKTWFDKPGEHVITPDPYPHDNPPAVVPEASTLAGLASALVFAGPGMAGWLRRRKA